MGEEVRITEYTGGGGDDDDRVLEWEAGLPSADDLTPLTQPLIPPELASAFRITPEPRRSMVDVNRASQNTLSSLRSNQTHALSSSNNKNTTDHIMVDSDDPDRAREDGSESRKTQRRTGDNNEDADSRNNDQEDGGSAGGGARTLKRPRLVWTPQLHKRFVDVVAHLGIKNAVPKTIMQLMNVEGLTRENVASHLQKYRLYLKRMQGLSNEGPSPSDHLFASTPVPQSLNESLGGASAGASAGAGAGGGHNTKSNNNNSNSSNGAISNSRNNGHIGMAYQHGLHQMVPMPPMMGMPPGGYHHIHNGNNYHGYESHYGNHHHHQQYGGIVQQKFGGAMAPYHHHQQHQVAPNEK